MHLYIDLETYSSVDITSCGMYKYVESEDFEILLLAYSLDGGPVRVLDLCQGEDLPEELPRQLLQEDITKHAYNAAFEWYCLARYLGLDESSRNQWLGQWRCTMLQGSYCGYPLGLGAVTKALGITEDKQKLAAGKALIRYFCTPCNPTKTNYQRTRNLPRHDPAKWALFKDYNAQDVVAEMAVGQKLRGFPVPEQIQQQWVLDQISNARGVALDTQLVEGAIRCAEEATGELVCEAVALTGLENPNSRAQLLQWLQEEGEEVPDLKKATVAALLEGEQSPKTRRLLEIRQELGKTSVSKYRAMARTLCQDGRVRGLLQFYGANRTGRWAGRLVQVQNLPQTHLPALDLGRQLARAGDLCMLRWVYGNAPDALAQMIRTAFVAGAGKVFVDADFSAIEARVVAWLAGESWVLEVFQTHGKIYEAAASQMFGVPLDCIVKGRPEYALRQKGKVATLALGYQGSTNALIAMGALRMGLKEEELPEIVQRWRQANKRIVSLWYALDAAAVQVLRTGRPEGINGLVLAREGDLSQGLDFLTIALPSGRKLFYAKPFLTTNQWGRDSVSFYGMNQKSKRWELSDTYGGRLVENCVQAIARDCLAEKITQLERAGYPVAFHVHDEVVLEVEKDRANLDAVCKILAEPMPWAPDLPLKAEGWVGDYFTKD